MMLGKLYCIATVENELNYHDDGESVHINDDLDTMSSSLALK
jgi:hypothetical protein